MAGERYEGRGIGGRKGEGARGVAGKEREGVKRRKEKR